MFYHKTVEKLQERGEKKLWAVRAREKVVKMKRSRYEIMAGIMQNCLSPRGKTHIRHKAYLNSAQTNDYLSLLTSLGLLSKKNGKYETTDKGRQFISAYNQLIEIISVPPFLSLTVLRVLLSSSPYANC